MNPIHSELKTGDASWQRVQGNIVRGHGVASGTGVDRRYPAGTLQMQRPFFAERGLDLSPFHDGTLNLDIAPLSFNLAHPTHTFRQVEWTHLHPPEDFSFSRCRLIVKNQSYKGWVYTPHPDTKAAHFQPPSMLEIIAPFIAGMTYGSRVDLMLDPAEIYLIDPVAAAIPAP